MHHVVTFKSDSISQASLFSLERHWDKLDNGIPVLQMPFKQWDTAFDLLKQKWWLLYSIINYIAMLSTLATGICLNIVLFN